MKTIKLSRSSNQPQVFINSQLPSSTLKAIEKATSYIIKDADHIDNRQWQCECGWRKLVIKHPSNICDRCKKSCEMNFWDYRIRLMNKTHQGFYYFPIGLLDTVTEVIEAYGFSVEYTETKEKPTKTLELEWNGPELRDYQKEIIEIAKEKLDRGKGCILEMPTGSGKTLTFLKMLHEYGVPTLIIVHTAELMQQWYNVIAKTLEYNAGRYGNKRNEIKDITIAMVQSLYKTKDFPFNKFKMICSDECLDGGMEIDTEIGKIKIKDIVEKKMKIKVRTHTGKLRKIRNYYKIQTTKQMMEIEHERGKTTCTEDHKFLTQRGWIEAKNLNSRDMLYTIE
jgi:hypothetical protein